MDQQGKEFYAERAERFEEYKVSVDWARNGFNMILDSIRPDWRADEPGIFVDLPDLRIYSDGKGRDQKVIMVGTSREFNEERLTILVGMFEGLEEMGWDDLDAVEWTTRIGFGSHGIPKEIPPELYQGWGNEDGSWTHLSYAIIQCSDWMS